MLYRASPFFGSPAPTDKMTENLKNHKKIIDKWTDHAIIESRKIDMEKRKQKNKREKEVSPKYS
jgi:hypothetical protein